MRWLIGCVALGLVACVSCACLGTAALFLTGGGSGPALPAGVSAPATPPPVNPQAAASFNQKVTQFNQQLARTQPGGGPVTLQLTGQEVSSAMQQALAGDLGAQANVAFDGLFVDFQQDRMVFSGRVRPDGGGAPIGIQGQARLTPVGAGIRIDFDRVDITGVLPFPIPATPFVQSFLEQNSPGGAVFDTPFRIESLTMRDGQLTVVARPR